MSDFRRAYDVLRGYVNHEWDRIRAIDLDKAWDELSAPSNGPKPVAEADTDTPTVSLDPKESAAGILGVATDASFEDMKKAFDKLNKRCNPANFPEGSEEAENAARIQVRVNWAFRILTEDKSEAERRFKSLEID